jgi:GNAT superfamily N-acetyltransferase
METTQQQLLDNHLAFLASHRGLIRTEANIVYVESDRPEFTYVIPGRNSKVSDLSSLVKTLQHLPWSGLSTEDIKGLGFASKFGISYMVLDDKAPEWSVRKDLGIERVQNRDLMDVFSRVQSRSFNEADESFEAWYPWLKAANQRNLNSSNQAFYIGKFGDEALGVVLTVDDGQSTGIYAVGTLPSRRKEGISTTLMKQAILEARAEDAWRTITLQVKQDSSVEAFYLHLGFKRVFTSEIYGRN